METFLYWSFPVLLFTGITTMAICLSHLRKIKPQKYSRSVDISIVILCFFTGVPGFAIFNYFAEIPAGPWNLPIVIVFGILTKNLLLGVIEKYWSNTLTTFSLKHFG